MNTKQINESRLQNISIDILKQKYEQVRLVLVVFASYKLFLNYIKQPISAIDAISKLDDSFYIWIQEALNDEIATTLVSCSIGK